MGLQNIFKDIDRKQITGVIVGLVITGLLTSAWGIVKTFVFPTRNITGEWTVYVTTDKTHYNPYKHLTSIFRFTITQYKNGTLIGTGEKVRDINPDGSITKYDAVQRDQVKYDGVIEQPYFGKANASLDITCKGLRYKSTAHYEFKIVGKDSATGTFTTSIADGSGRLTMKKDK